MSSILILGATGLVGQQLLAKVLADPAVVRVVAPTRRPLVSDAKLINPLVDYENLPLDAAWWHADIALCALGTTMKQAGTQQAFYRVDHDYVVAAASLAQAAGTSCFVLNSSVGAALDAASFYLRTKAEAERDVGALGFASLTCVRPSFLDGGARPDKRPGEAFAISITKILGGLIPKRWRPISTAKLATAMLAAGLAAQSGVRVIESQDLH